MANTGSADGNIISSGEKVSISHFSIEGLFGYLDHAVPFPETNQRFSAPNILIIEGQNGTGKTTILNMIAGMLELDFDEFRRVPFRSAMLKLSNGDQLKVVYNPQNADFPLNIIFREHSVYLKADRHRPPEYDPILMDSIERLRAEALPILATIDFELISIDRSLGNRPDPEDVEVYVGQAQVRKRASSKNRLTKKVLGFMKEAQVNYRRFFQAEDLDLLPRMIRRIQEKKPVDRGELVSKVQMIKDRNARIIRFGLQTEEDDIRSLDSILNNTNYSKDQDALNLISSYIEMHENIAQARDLIVNRLEQFENIMSDFLVGKTVRVNTVDGLRIEGFEGNKLSENDFSSGEFHFVYMMVAALLCERTGTILAVDEPELSLHVSWQRKLISALSNCASGASPLFLFATHSTAISAAHRNSVIRLNAVD